MIYSAFGRKTVRKSNPISRQMRIRWIRKRKKRIQLLYLIFIALKCFIVTPYSNSMPLIGWHDNNDRIHIINRMEEMLFSHTNHNKHFSLVHIFIRDFCICCLLTWIGGGGSGGICVFVVWSFLLLPFRSIAFAAKIQRTPPNAQRIHNRRCAHAMLQTTKPLKISSFFFVQWRTSKTSQFMS